MSRSSSDCATGRCRKTSSIRFTPRPEGHPGLRAPGTKRGRRAAPATLSARLGGHVTLEARADGNIVACFDGHSVGLGKFSAGAADRAQDLRTGLPLGSFASGGRTIDKEIHLLVRRLAGHGLLEYRLGRSRRRQARTRSSSSRRFPIIGRERRSSAMPTFSSCRGSRICAGAATRWSWNRRAPARCSGFAIRRLRPPWPCCRRRNKSNGSAGRTAFPGVELLALLVDCQILFKVDAARDSGLRPAEGDDNLVLWDFHDLLFHARSTEGRHANPMGGRLSLCRRHASAAGGAAALARKENRSAQVLGRASRSQSRRPQSSCVNVIRRASSMTSDRSRSPSLRGFSTAPRASSRDGTAGSTSATAVRWSRTPPGRIRREAAATSSSSIWPSTNAKGLRADSIITTPADTRWCRSACARMSSKRCWREPNLRWARPPRPRS